MRAMWRRMGAVLVAGACVLAAACGGGDEEAGTTAAPAPVTSAAPAPDEPTGPRTRTVEFPVAAVQDDFFPVDAIENIPARVQLVRDLGVRVARFDVFWATVAPEQPGSPTDPDDPAYDWSRVDLIMRELAAADITPIISVFNTPTWATDGPAPEEGVVINTAAPRPDDYAAFMEAFATRYRGDFTPAGESEPLPAGRRIEIWNEPNLGGFFRPQVDESGERVSLDNYADMVKAAYPAIKRANPDSIVIVGVGGPRSSSGDSGTGALDWLRGLREREIPLDAYSQHIYPAAPPTAETDVVPSWGTIDLLLEELDGFREGVQLYITEAGYTTATTPFRNTAVTEEEQAQYLQEIFALPQLQTNRIPVVVQFNLQDNANWPAGLLRSDGSQKPAYEVYRGIVESQGGATLTR